MTPVRRIAAAVLVAALGLGTSVGVAPASAGIDTTWGGKVRAHN